MKKENPVLKLTMQIGLGMVICTALMLVVYAVIGKLDHTVVFGALLGCFVGTMHFLLMGVAVQRAAKAVPDGPDQPDSVYAEEDADPERDAGEGTENSTGVSHSPMTDQGRRMKKQMQASYGLRMGLLVVLSLLAVLTESIDTLAYVIPLIFPRIILMAMSFMNQE